MRFFMWKYFQGALAFKHGQGCKECGQPLTHNHIFFNCFTAKPYWEKADRAIQLFLKHSSVPTRPLWVERAMWMYWSSLDANDPIRVIAAATMMEIWGNRPNKPSTPRKWPTLDLMTNIKLHLVDQIAIAKQIRDEDYRNEQICLIHEQWRTNTPIWYHSYDAYELQPSATHFVQHGNDSPLGRSLLKRLRKREAKALAERVPEPGDSLYFLPFSISF